MNAHNSTVYKDLMVDYLEEVFDLTDIIDFMSTSRNKTITQFTEVVRNEYDWHAERQEEHTPRTKKLADLLDHLEVLIP